MPVQIIKFLVASLMLSTALASHAQGIPDLSNLDYETRDSIQLACLAQKMEGPAVYGQCIENQLAQMHQSPAIPDLSQLDYETRHSIQLACLAQKMEGPAAYARCIEKQLIEIGLTAGGLPRAETVPVPQPRPAPEIEPQPRQVIAAPYISKATVANWLGPRPPLPNTVSTERLEASEIFERSSKSVYVVVAAPSLRAIETLSNIFQGSAVAVAKNIALTNCHVVARSSVIVLIQNDELYEAILKYADFGSDRCLLETQTKNLVPVSGIRPYDSLKVGEAVYSIGSPGGLEHTLGEGIVSGLRRSEGRRYIQTSAPISPGSSGGGLFDQHANLIGITTFLLRDAQNLNFAIAAGDFWNR